MSAALSALRRVSFDWTAHIDEIWVDQDSETNRLQAAARDELAERLEDLAAQRRPASPLGTPVLGPAGAGKTHLLGNLRKQALEREFYFILADMTDVADFWDTVSLGYLRSLQQNLGGGKRQVDLWLERMVDLYGKNIRKARDIPKQRPPGLINRTEELIQQVRKEHRAEIQEHADVLRALVLFACDHADINDLGYKWLQGMAIDEDELGVFGFRQQSQTPSRIVRGMSWLLSITGSTVLALDQLDAIVAEHELSRAPASQEEPDSEQQRRSLAIIQGIAGGLRDLRDLTRRTLTVVSALEATWDVLDRQAQVSMVDRYEEPLLLRPGSDPEIYKEMVIGRLAVAYAEQGFTPPYPHYPYTDSFFVEHRGNTPRELLKACDAHRQACRRARAVSETGSRKNRDSASTAGSDTRARFQPEFERLAAAAELDAVLLDAAEVERDRLVEHACDALVIENPVPDIVAAKVDKDFMGTGNYDPLHARIRLILPGERERHHAFRFLEKGHYRAFQARLKAAMTESGVDPKLSFRGLTILRCAPPPTGAATAKLLAELQARGGRMVVPSEADLRRLVALRALWRSTDDPEGLEEWLEKERPISRMDCFAQAVASLFEPLRAEPTSTPQQGDRGVSANKASAGAEPSVPMSEMETRQAASPQFSAAPSVASPAAAAPKTGGSNAPAVARSLPVGREMREPHAPASIALERLPYHTCVFGGSGSGKTVFLKRVVEEAALLGIPSLVLDGANDLSRLGTPWPSPPSAWSSEDVEQARRYHQRAEVVVWTPGAPLGNPLTLDPMAALRSADEAGTEAERSAQLDEAVEVVTSSIADMVVGGGKSAKIESAILKKTIRLLAGRDASLADLARALSEPDESAIEKYAKGEKMAQDLSERLYAEIENDTLLRSGGAALDPALLFGAQNPARTRVSVVSLAGLSGDAKKRRFVDQLSGTLFSWIKKNPAPAGGLIGLLVIDEAKDFVPSGRSVPGKANLIRLAAQARKYGLGLLFATQEPKSIDHNVVSNCENLLGGRMNSPAAIEALQQLLSDRGANVSDVARMERGTFYFGTAAQRPRKIRTALCLSHHPSTPPSESQVIEAAKRSAERFLGP